MQGNGYQKQFVIPKKIVDEILSVSESLRYILVVDQNGEAVFSHTTPRSLISDGQSESVAKDIHFLRGLLKVYDDIVGENIFTHMIRERGHILIFHKQGWLFLVTCDNSSRHEVADVADSVEEIITRHMQ
ncbi:MAG TPA: hypothetical protein VJ792_08630 [Candidatus Nitrosotalea sp.]|nr:hypothetical protein [Candidatus Nitrosotalea sp.]